MSDDFDFSLFGEVLTKPSTGESADPVDVLTNKVVRAPPPPRRVTARPVRCDDGERIISGNFDFC